MGEKLREARWTERSHTPAWLCEAFAPAEAKRLADKIEIHYKPRHGSWLNIAEIELSALTRQCLDRRIAHQPTLVQQVAAWERERNTAEVTVDWHFSTTDARLRLKHLYPAILS